MSVGFHLAKDDVELIDPRVGGEAFELLRACHIREWRDEGGHWHVIIPAYRLAEIEAAQVKYMEGNDGETKHGR